MRLGVILLSITFQTEDAGDRPTGHYDEFGFMVDEGTCTVVVSVNFLVLKTT